MGCDQTKKRSKKRHIYDELNKSIDSFTSCDDISDNENIINRLNNKKTKTIFTLKNRKKFNATKDINNKVIQGSLNIADLLINNIIEKNDNERKLPDCNLLYSLCVFTEFREKNGFELDSQFNNCNRMSKVAFKRYESDYKKFIKLKNNKLNNRNIARNLNSSYESNESNNKKQNNGRQGLSTGRIKTNINVDKDCDKNNEDQEEFSSYMSKKNRNRNYTMIDNQKRIDNSADKYNNIIKKKKKLFLLDENPYIDDLKIKNIRREETGNFNKNNHNQFKENEINKETQKFNELFVLKNNKEISNNNNCNNKNKIPQIKNKKVYSNESEIIYKPINDTNYSIHNHQNSQNSNKLQKINYHSTKNIKKNYKVRRNDDFMFICNKTPKITKSNNKKNQPIYVHPKTPNRIAKNNTFSIIDKIDKTDFYVNNTYNNIYSNKTKIENGYRKSKISSKKNINTNSDNPLKDYLDKEISIIKNNPKHIKKVEQVRYSNSSNNSNNLNSDSYKVYSNSNSSSNNIITKSEDSLLNKLKFLKKSNCKDGDKEPTNIKIDLRPALTTLQDKIKNTKI